MSSGISGVGGATDPAAAATETAVKSKSDVSKEAFMTLLVAQIKHQDPLNPADGVQFMTQLAQFSELEQMMSMNAQLAGVHEELVKQNAVIEQQTAGETNV
jgi:flagellar basal-body rod modification protein FlgD